MLTISAMSPGQENYYLQLGREDYYLEGGEPPGVWFGQGAKALGLAGEVERNPLRSLFAGFAPDGKRTLVQNAGKKGRQPGWDMTVSAPKSVSVLWSAVDKEKQAVIESILMDATQRLVSFMETEIAHTRKGAGGIDIQNAKLACAAFMHHTSRAQEPQLHVHIVTPNAGLGTDGNWGALRSREDFYDFQQMLGTLWRADVAHGLARSGVELESDRFAFKVKRVPDKLCLAQSTRSKEISEYKLEHKLTAKDAGEIANKATRNEKGHVSREELSPAWRALNEEHGFSADVAAYLFRDKSQELTQADSPVVRKHSYDRAIDELMESKSSFPERDLQRKALEHIQSYGLDPYAEFAKNREFLHSSDEIVYINNKSEYDTFTTKSMYRAEEHVIKMADDLAKKEGKIAVHDLVKRVAILNGLSEEQTDAVKHVVGDKGNISCITGGAGSGKTRTLGAAKIVWNERNYAVVGCALGGSAAKELEKGSGIKSHTVAKLLYTLDDTFAQRMKNNLSPSEIAKSITLEGLFTKNHRLIHNKPLIQNKPLFNKKKQRPPRIKLTSKTVVVLDEASMLGTHDFARLISHIDRAGAKLVCVGDQKQLPAIEAGGVFHHLLEKYGAAKLEVNRRQQLPWMRQAVEQFRDGDPKGALSLYAKAEKLNIEPTRDEAKKSLIASWSRSRKTDLKESLILAGTNQDVDELNAAAQSFRRDKGELGRKSMKINGTRMFEGDRVLFTNKSNLYDVVNGDFATIEKIRKPRHPLEKGGFTVLLDSPSLGKNERVRISFEDYKPEEVRLGYASTTHKAQGTTIDRTFVLAGGWMQDRELSYVQMSRHRKDCQIFVSKEEAGEDLWELKQAMKESHAKELAHTHEQSRGLEQSLR